MAKRKISMVIVFFIWILLWIPLSFMLPSHGHFALGGVFAPLTVFIMPFMGSGGSESAFKFAFKYVYFPALIFWGGFILLVFIVSKYNSRIHRA